MGETLAAHTSDIGDDHGLTSVSYSFQWVANDGSSDSDITGATDSTYTLVDSDQGKTIKVRVTFTDDADNEETLTSAATGTVDARPNIPATGAPIISGTAQVGETLTADTSGIADADGLDNADFTYQWLADDTGISGATGSSYTLAEADEGQTIKVQVTFADDADNGETLTSAATGAVEPVVEPVLEPPPAPRSLTATVNGDGSVTLNWEAPDDDSVTGYQILRRRPNEGENKLLVHVADTGTTATTWTDTNVTAGTQHVYRVKAINAAGLGRQSNSARVTPPPDEPAQNSPATGAPAISGAVQVGETLTADTSGIADDDGLTGVSYSYQWVVSDGGTDQNIRGATDSTYTLVDIDQGLFIKVRVRFTDDAANEESLTSAATAEVAARPNTPATGDPTINGTAEVGETLTADTSGIADTDGLTNVSYSYQWIANDGTADTDITDATASTYTLVVSQT